MLGGTPVDGLDCRLPFPDQATAPNIDIGCYKIPCCNLDFNIYIYIFILFICLVPCVAIIQKLCIVEYQWIVLYDTEASHCRILLY